MVLAKAVGSTAMSLKHQGRSVVVEFLLQRMALGVGKDATDRRMLTTAPLSVVMGSADPDFKDPLAEAEAFAQDLGATITLADGFGHYSHTEDPEAVLEALEELSRRTGIAADA